MKYLVLVVAIFAVASVSPAVSTASARTYLYCKEAKRVAHHGGICLRLSSRDVILRRRGCNYQVAEYVRPWFWRLAPGRYPHYRVWRVC